MDDIQNDILIVEKNHYRKQQGKFIRNAAMFCTIFGM